MKTKLAALGLAATMMLGGIAAAPAASAEGPHGAPKCLRQGQLIAGAYRIQILENPQLNVQRLIYRNKFTHKRHDHLIKCSPLFYVRIR